MIIGFSQRSRTVLENYTTITLDVHSLRLSELDYEVEFIIYRSNTPLSHRSQYGFRLHNSTDLIRFSSYTLHSGDRLINGIEIILYDDPFPEEHERYVIDIWLWKGHCYHDGLYYGDYYEYDYEHFEDLYDQYGNLTDYFCKHTIYIEDNDG